MIQRNHLLQTKFSSRDRKFTFGVGMLMLILGLAMMGNNWSRDTYAPLAIMSGLFLLYLAALKVFNKTQPPFVEPISERQKVGFLSVSVEGSLQNFYFPQS